MKIIEITEFKKNKCKIFTDENLEFVLYKGDLKRYRLAIGYELSTKQKALLLEEILPHRAKERCMKLLQSRDYTEGEIRIKLTDDGYPQSVVAVAIDFLQSYRYLDDERYVKLYFQSKSLKKSKKVIILELQQKGIAKETIYNILEEMQPENNSGGDIYCIRKLLNKKKYNDSSATFDEKEKIKAYLFRKGFEMKDIIFCMKDFSGEKYIYE